MELIFHYPAFLWFLLLLPVLVVVHFYSLRAVERRALLFANYRAMSRITGGEPVQKNYWLLAVRIFTLLTFVLAASGATLLVDSTAANYDAVIAVDASNSMTATDFAPSRIDAAILGAKEFVAGLPPSSRVGVVRFASTAVMLTEPSDASKEGAVGALDAISASSIGGTAIGDAIVTSVNSLSGSDRAKAVILLTDGNSNTGVGLYDAADYASQAGVKLLIIGMGSDDSSSQLKTGAIAGLNMSALDAAARATGGQALNARDSGELGSAFRSFAMESTSFEQPVALGSFLMVVAFALVFVDWWASSSKYRIIP